MNNVMNISYDGIGLINNRGKSKYWGVSADPIRTGKWRVLATLHNKIFTFALPEYINTEKNAAHFAKHLYHLHFASHVPIHMYVYDRFSNNIYTINFVSQTIEEFSNLEGNALPTTIFDWTTLSSMIDDAGNGKAKIKKVEKKEKLILQDDDYESLDTIADMLDNFELPDNDFDTILNFAENALSNEMSPRGRAVLLTMATVFSQ